MDDSTSTGDFPALDTEFHVLELEDIESMIQSASIVSTTTSTSPAKVSKKSRSRILLDLELDSSDTDSSSVAEIRRNIHNGETENDSTSTSSEGEDQDSGSHYHAPFYIINQEIVSDSEKPVEVEQTLITTAAGAGPSIKVQSPPSPESGTTEHQPELVQNSILPIAITINPEYDKEVRVPGGHSQPTSPTPVQFNAKQNETDSSSSDNMEMEQQQPDSLNPIESANAIDLETMPNSNPKDPVSTPGLAVAFGNLPDLKISQYYLNDQLSSNPNHSPNDKESESPKPLENEMETSNKTGSHIEITNSKLVNNNNDIESYASDPVPVPVETIVLDLVNACKNEDGEDAELDQDPCQSPTQSSNSDHEPVHVRNLFREPVPDSSCSIGLIPTPAEVVEIKEATTTTNYIQNPPDLSFSQSEPGDDNAHVACPSESEQITFKSTNFILDLINEQKPKADTIIRLKDGILGAHKLVLATCSPFLGQLLIEQNEITISTIILPDIRKHTMKKVLHLIYTGFLLYSPDENEQRSEIQDAMNIIRVVSPRGFTVQPVEPSAIQEFKEHCLKKPEVEAKGPILTVPIPSPEPGISREIHRSLVQRVVGRSPVKPKSNPTTTKNLKKAKCGRRKPCHNPRPKIHTVISSEFYKLSTKEEGISSVRCTICQKLFESRDQGFLDSAINNHFALIHKDIITKPLGDKVISMLQGCDVCNQKYETVGEAESCLKSHEHARCWKCLESFPLDLIRDHYLSSHVDAQSIRDSVNTFIRCNWCPKLVNIRLSSDVVGLHGQCHLPPNQIPEPSSEELQTSSSSSEFQKSDDDEESESDASEMSAFSDDLSVGSSKESFIVSDSNSNTFAEESDVDYTPKQTKIRITEFGHRLKTRRGRKRKMNLESKVEEVPTVQSKRLRLKLETQNEKAKDCSEPTAVRNLPPRHAKRRNLGLKK